MTGLQRKADRTPGQAPDAIEFSDHNQGFSALFLLDPKGHVSEFKIAQE
jgi:hypothetical protein